MTKFEKANNGNFKCPVCKRSMWSKEEAVAKHAAKCPGRSKSKRSSSALEIEALTKTVKVIQKPKALKVSLAKYRQDLKVAEEALRTSTDGSMRIKLKDRIRYLKKRIEEF